MKLNSICVITNGYPTKEDPIYAFIRPVVCGFADNGIECTVIAPQSLTKSLGGKRSIRPKHWFDYTAKGNKIEIYQPRYMSLSLLRVGNYSLSTLFRDQAIKKAYKRLNRKPDALYAHFWDCGVAATRINETGVPIYVVSGESEIRVLDRYPKAEIGRAVKKIAGLICVSTKNLDESKELGLYDDNMRTIVIPNAIDNSIFKVLDKNELREKLSIDQNEKVACFVGAFINRKGVMRLVSAAKKVPELKLILIGSGTEEPISDQIIFKGKVPHEKIPEYLNAADVFVLPTLAEGCCNAIIEALACGLPVVSSDLPFNKDVLNKDNAILIDPLSEKEIAQAIRDIVGDENKTGKMREKALETAAGLTIEKRIKKIIEFIQNN